MRAYWTIGGFAAAALATLLWTGCSDDGASQTCSPGESRECSCGSGGKGTQICAPDGISWETCKGCPLDGGNGDADSDGPTGDGPISDGPAGDAAVTDAAAGDVADLGAVDGSMGKHPWTKMPAGSATTTLNAVWGTSSTNVYVVGNDGKILHMNGRKSLTGSWWTPVSSGATGDLHDVWGSGAFDVAAAGEGGLLLHRNGYTWGKEPTGLTAELRAIWGSGYTDVYLLGEFGAMVHSDRTSVSKGAWKTIKPGSSSTFLGAWGTSATDVYVVGSSGTILRHDGSAWKAMTSGTSEHLLAVWGSSGSNIFAVGEKGVALRYDGSTWTKTNTGTTVQLRGVWGSGPSDVFAVGNKGTILHHDGAGWTKQISTTSFALRDVWGSGPSDVYAVGAYNTILHFGPCDCKVGSLCYQKGDRDSTGCKACDPASSTTALGGVTGGCSIASSCYAAGEGNADGCKTCDPTQSATTWTQVTGGCAVGAQCFNSGHQGPTSCESCVPASSSTSWTLDANVCQISGACYASGASDTTGCQKCDPSKSASSWTPVTGKCFIKGVCHANGAKDSTGCRVCDTSASATSWTVISGKCLIGTTCHSAGTKDSSGCRSCNPASSTTAWTVDAGKCHINNTCVNTGTSDSTGCQTCDPSKDATDWSMIANKCLIGVTCYAGGTSGSATCQVCDPAKSTSSWSQVANTCFIDSACYSKDDKDSSGCQLCDPAQSSTAWSKVPCSAGALIPKQVTFATGTSSSLMVPATINSDGKSYSKLAGFGTLYFQTSYLYGRVRQYYPFTLDGPQQRANLPYSPIHLPGGYGQIRYFRDNTASKVGVIHVKPTGDVKILYSTAGTSTSSLYYYFAVSDDGKRVATHRPKKGVVLMRTDGLTFSTGKSWVELDPTPAPYYIYTTSVTIAGNKVYMVSRGSSSSSQHTLWSAPTDGSAGFSKVTLPLVGGAAPVWIDDEIAFSDDGSKVVITAGKYTSSSYSTAEDVIVIDAAGKATNLTKAPANYEERSYTWGYSSSGCQLAVSTKGTHVAYVKYTTSSKVDLYVAKADGTGAPAHVTAATNFGGTYLRIFSLKFLDDDNLIFTAYGSSSSYGDIFRYRVSTGTLSNLTKFNSSVKPYAPTSMIYFRTYGMWRSPNKKFLYFIQYYKPAGSTYYLRDIRAVDLTTWALKDITTGAEVYTSADAFGSCGGKATMYFAAEPAAASGTKLQLFAFDMNLATKAQQLTNITASMSTTYNYVYDLTPNADCSRVAFRAGYSSRYDVYSVKPGTTPVVSNLTNSQLSTASHYVYDYMSYSQDSTQLIYFAGAASNKYVMMVGRSSAGGTCCAPQKVYAGTGTYNYWTLFGVK